MSWQKLVESKTDLFGPGLLLRFRSTDAPEDGDIVAIAVHDPACRALSFFQLSGHKAGYPMGYRQPTLPADSTAPGIPASVRREWLLANFENISFGLDADLIEYAEYFKIEVLPPPWEAQPTAERMVIFQR